MYRYLTLLVGIGILILSFVAEPVQAQVTCDLILKEPNGNLKVFPDTGRIVQTVARRGDTIQVPIALRNDSSLAGFEFYLDVDTTWLKPRIDVIDLGTPYYKINATSRLDLNALDVFQATPEFVYTSPTPNHLRLKILGFPPFGEIPQIAVARGTGTIFTLEMIIDSAGQQNDQATIGWYYANIEDSSAEYPYPIIGCQFSQYTSPSGIYRGTLTTISGFVRIDSNATPAPVISSFTANPTTITAGGSSTLSWSVTNADTLTITPGPIKRTDLTGSVSVSPSSTTTYTLTAKKNIGPIEVTSQATVTVQPVGANNLPVVSPIVPNAYTITQGENVSFSVTATDADNEFLTLAALGLPSNASFGVGGQVTGVGTATGNFSFSPNITQEGVFTVGFRATDAKNGQSQTVNVTITVEKIENDILFSKSREGGSPVGALAGKTGILLPIDLVSSQEVYGIQFDFLYEDEFFTVDSIIATNRTQDWVIYDNMGDTPGQIRIMTFGMEGQPLAIDTSNSTTVLYVAMSIDSLAGWGDYPVGLENGWESNNPDPAYPSLALVTESAIIQVDRLGDVNLDKRVDVADAVNIVSSILGNITLLPRQFDVADIVVDQSVDVFDLVGVINTAFGLPVEQPSPAAPSVDDVLATVDLSYGDMFIGSTDELVVHSDLPEDIAGVQLDIRYDPSSVLLGKPVVASDAEGLALTYKNNGAGRMLVLLHFTNPFNQDQLIQRGLADLVTIPMTAQHDVEYGNPSQLKLADVKLSTPTGKSVAVKGFGATLPSSFMLRQNYPNPFNPNTTIEFALSGQVEHVTLDIFNVLGQTVRRLVDKPMAAGEYSVEWDATADNGNKVATGVYLYRLQVGNRADTKKMLLLK